MRRGVQGLTHGSESLRLGAMQMRTACHLNRVQMIGLLVRKSKLVRLSLF